MFRALNYARQWGVQSRQSRRPRCSSQHMMTTAGAVGVAGAGSSEVGAQEIGGFAAC